MESVEELCDSIALIHKSQKLLEGKVKEIRNSFRTGTYLIEYDGTGSINDNNGLYEVVNRQEVDAHTELQLKLQVGIGLNQVLAHMLPQVAINKVQEVVPTMNEIFIDTVSKRN
jgi:ABC-2 type transport system ATP-binding protein